MDAILNLLANWLMPAAPWICQAYARSFWVNGVFWGAVIGVPTGGIFGGVCLLLARLLLWLIRKRDKR